MGFNQQKTLLATNNIRTEILRESNFEIIDCTVCEKKEDFRPSKCDKRIMKVRWIDIVSNKYSRFKSIIVVMDFNLQDPLLKCSKRINVTEELYSP